MVEQIGAHAHGLFSHHRGLWETRAQYLHAKTGKSDFRDASSGRVGVQNEPVG